jgi:hypothetical protein
MPAARRCIVMGADAVAGESVSSPGNPFPDEFMGVRDTAPRIDIDQEGPAGGAPRLRLSGRWTLRFATDVGTALAAAPAQADAVVDATGVERLDSAGVLQLLRFARRNDMARQLGALRGQCPAGA